MKKPESPSLGRASRVWRCLTGVLLLVVASTIAEVLFHRTVTVVNEGGVPLAGLVVRHGPAEFPLPSIPPGGSSRVSIWRRHRKGGQEHAFCLAGRETGLLGCCGYEGRAILPSNWKVSLGPAPVETDDWGEVNGCRELDVRGRPQGR